MSNDNPYSEATFKTLKYCPAYPGKFSTIDQAREFMGAFVNYDNHHRYHSGINYYTPASVFDGSWRRVQQQRQAVMDRAYQATPARFPGGRPHVAPPPSAAYINQTKSTIETAA